MSITPGPGNTFEINGIPDAHVVIGLEDRRSQRIAHLQLHRTDLEFANECLDAITEVPDEPEILQEALWRCAIMHYFKCFGDSAARSRLNPDKVLKSDAMGKTIFQFMLNLRNKHFLHDENAYAQGQTCAVLNDGTKPYKVEKILGFSVLGQTLVQDNYSNMKLLVTRTLEWLNVEFDSLCDDVTEELERVPYDELSKRLPLVYRAPTFEDVARNRRET